MWSGGEHSEKRRKESDLLDDNTELQKGKGQLQVAYNDHLFASTEERAVKDLSESLSRFNSIDDLSTELQKTNLSYPNHPFNFSTEGDSPIQESSSKPVTALKSKSRTKGEGGLSTGDDSSTLENNPQSIFSPKLKLRSKEGEKGLLLPPSNGEKISERRSAHKLRSENEQGFTSIKRPMSLDKLSNFSDLMKSAPRRKLHSHSQGKRTIKYPKDLATLDEMRKKQIIELFEMMGQQIENLQVENQKLLDSIHEMLSQTNPKAKNSASRFRRRSSQFPMNSHVTRLAEDFTGRTKGGAEELLQDSKAELQSMQLHLDSNVLSLDSPKRSRIRHHSNTALEYPAGTMNAAFPFEDPEKYTGINCHYNVFFHSIFREFPLQQFEKDSEPIGSGTYAHVYLVRDRDTSELFALKQFKHLTFKIKQGLPNPYNEIGILRKLCHDQHPNIVALKGVSFERIRRLGKIHGIQDYCYFSSPDLFFEWMDGGNLYEYISANYAVSNISTDTNVYTMKRDPLAGAAGFFTKKTFKRVTDPQRIRVIKHILSSILAGLSFLHEHQIIHRDIKTSNILLTKKNKVKISDFGFSLDLSSNMNSESNDQKHPQVYTYCYRAPEVYQYAEDKEKNHKRERKSASTNSLATLDYGFSADIFALGMIMAELYFGFPMLHEVKEDALRPIMKQMFNYSDSVSMQQLPLFENMTEDIMSKHCKNVLKSGQNLIFTQLWHAMDEDYVAFDLFLKLTTGDSSMRYTASQALHHPYFSTSTKSNEVV